MAPGSVECVACGGSGESSKGEVCFPCKGTGSGMSDEPPAPTELVQHSSKTVEHFTPAPIVEAARRVLKAIDLDPASCPLAQEIVRAEAWYGPGSPYGENGLAEPWLGRVFLNPPGGKVSDEYAEMGTRSNAALWWATLAEAWRTGEVEAAIFVGFTLEILRSAQALDVLQPLDFPLCVPSSRIAFDTTRAAVIGPEKKMGLVRVSSSSPTHANVIVYLPPMIEGAEPDLRAADPGAVAFFARVFGAFGGVRA